MHRVGIYAALLALLATTAAEAVEPHRVALIVSPSQQDGIALLRAELEALGLEISEVSLGDEPGDPASLPPSTNNPEEFRIVLRPTRVEVWTFDRGTGKIRRREVFAESDGTPLDTRTAVLHTVELLRWQLREREPKTRRGSASGARSRPATPAAVPDPEPPHAWLFSLVPQALYSPGGTSLGVGAEFDVAWRWSRFAARLFASSALLPNELSSSEGTAQVTSRAIGLEGVLLSNERPSLSGLEASLGVGVALVGTELRASAASGYRAEDDQLLAIAPLLDLRASYVVNRSVAIVLCSSLVTPLRSSSLRFGDHEAGSYGRLIVNVGLGPQITVF